MLFRSKLGAQKILLVAPYLAYMRQDIAFHPGEIVSQKIIGRFLSELVDGLITVDPHLHRISRLDEAFPGPYAIALSGAPMLAELIAKERSVAELKAAESGKPAEIVTKMVEGSVQKFLKEVSLLNQSFVKNDKQTVEQMLKDTKSTVKAFTMYVVGEGIEKKQDDFAAEVAAQVAAAKQA